MSRASHWLSHSATVRSRSCIRRWRSARFCSFAISRWMWKPTRGSADISVNCIFIPARARDLRTSWDSNGPRGCQMRALKGEVGAKGALLCTGKYEGGDAVAPPCTEGFGKAGGQEVVCRLLCASQSYLGLSRRADSDE